MLKNYNLKEKILKTLTNNKALDVVTIDLEGKTSIADYMIIASGTSSRHLQSLSEQVLEECRRNLNKKLPKAIPIFDDLINNINVQILTAEAALTNKKEHIYHAAMLDPLTGANLSIDEIYSMVDKLIEAHGNYLPKYH